MKKKIYIKIVNVSTTPITNMVKKCDNLDLNPSNSYLLLDSLDVTVVLAPPTVLLKSLMLSEEYKLAGLL